MATSFFKPSAPTFGAVLCVVHFLYYHKDVYPRLYEKPLAERSGGRLSYLCAEKRAFGQFLYWTNIGILFYVFYDYYYVDDEMITMMYALQTFYFILEIFFIYRMRTASEARDYRISKTIKLFGVLCSILTPVFYFFSGDDDTLIGVLLVLVGLRSLLYDGYLFSLGGCSRDHQMAIVPLRQSNLSEYAQAYNDATV